MKAEDVPVDDFIRLLKERVVRVRIMSGSDIGAMKEVVDAKIEHGTLVLIAR